MIYLIAVLTITLFASCIVAVMLWNAPVGYEDDDGWHPGIKENGE